ncbi:MAG: hypothetical protein K8F92_16310 [Hyphomicrobium sp.]|uniref:hypothetical protein n=1 Tax=Hyphomicrobium sp. TaxID=82 RepID=UPI00132B61C4|nr:hypothetical protein [Hyphomicrobium sp.]KAB2939374.1 MAG: hypothetical protein F9K20_17320 [Hyphomicrobium sp.]MBZ0211195.1 hypothetical protein [Hyphomicrobium sp.]
MSPAIVRVLHRLFWAVTGSAVGGGIILWLATNGIDLQQAVAYVLQQAQEPENLLYTLPTMALIGVTALYLLFQLWERYGRPPRSAAMTLRKALVAVNEHTLDVCPDSRLANAALRSLRGSLQDLAPYEKLAGSVTEILELSEAYLFHLASESSAGAVDVASVHDRALAAVDALMLATRWAAEPDDE